MGIYENTDSPSIEDASLFADIQVGSDKHPFKVRVSTSAYNIGLDTFSSAAGSAYAPATSDSAFPVNFKMSLPHEQMPSLFDDNSFPFHYELFNEEVHL